MGRFSALRLHPRPLGEVASLVSSASSLPTSQWGGEALLGYSASPSLTGRAARASGKGAPLSSRLGGATPIGSSTSPSPTRQWGGGSLALPHSPVGRGGPTRLFSLALARRPRRSRQWGGREALLNSSASLSPTWGGDAARHFNLALAHSPVGKGGRRFSGFQPRSGSRPLGEEAPLGPSALPLPTCKWGGEALLGRGSPSASLTPPGLTASTSPTHNEWEGYYSSHQLCPRPLASVKGGLCSAFRPRPLTVGTTCQPQWEGVTARQTYWPRPH